MRQECSCCTGANGHASWSSTQPGPTHLEPALGRNDGAAAGTDDQADQAGGEGGLQRGAGAGVAHLRARHRVGWGGWRVCVARTGGGSGTAVDTRQISNYGAARSAAKGPPPLAQSALPRKPAGVTWVLSV